MPPPTLAGGLSGASLRCPPQKGPAQKGPELLFSVKRSKQAPASDALSELEAADALHYER